MRRIIGVLLALGAAAMLSVTAFAASDGVYVQQSGHNLTGPFLHFWEQNGGLELFGYPITEEFTGDGATYQYFQRARLERRGDRVSLSKIGIELGVSQPGADFAWPASRGDGWRYFPGTGHIVGGAFYDFFESNGSAEIFGRPISGEISLADRTVQYFERVRMEWDGSSVFLGFLGNELAESRGFDTSNVEQWRDFAAWAPSDGLFSEIAAPAAPVAEGKVIVVNLTDQRLRTYENGKLLVSTPITTGRPELSTPAGDFAVGRKNTDYWFISPWDTDSQWWYESVQSSYALYYATGGFYIHDAPWRADFGPGTNLWHTDSTGDYVTGSHGCINVPLEPMTQIFAWADVGTTVTVTY